MLESASSAAVVRDIGLFGRVKERRMEQPIRASIEFVRVASSRTVGPDTKKLSSQVYHPESLA